MHSRVEKALKSVLVVLGLSPKHTHSIRELVDQLEQQSVNVPLQEDDYDLIDSIYVTSKYPPESALPDTMPDEATCLRCLGIADNILAWADTQVTDRTI
ncbi:MAG: HEPN domain-containing protein [Planctomycetota bacterium]|jgi:HEPN domain-containing protein